MDSRVNDSNTICKNVNCQRCASYYAHINYVQDLHNNKNTNDCVFDTNDQTNLIENCVLKNKQFNYQYCILSRIIFIHILCIAVLTFFSIYLTYFNNEIFEKKFNNIWSFSIESNSIPTKLSTSNDNCKPLYMLVYGHCCVWCLFLILDQVVKHIHNQMLRSRGHLRAYVKFSRLAEIPFQLVSLWTVLLVIFMTVYAQQDKSDMQPYCDANMLVSPKNGIALLLIIEFICVLIFSLVYGISIRKFCLTKPLPDICGWDINNHCIRWTPHVLHDNNSSSFETNSEGILNYGQPDSQCIIDLLEYYIHVNKELVAKLGHTSQKLHELEIENQSLRPSQS